MSSSKASRHKRIVRHQWHALPVEAVAEALQSKPDGLSSEEVTERGAVYGKNEFSEQKPPGIPMRIAGQLKSPLTVILIIAAIITFGLGEFIDASVITFALLIAVVLGLVQEGRASKAFARLSQSQVHVATVVRDGKKHEIQANELVPGDVILMHDGIQVPADVRLIEAKKLSMNEATLTGEWLPVTKHTHRVEVGTPFSELTNMAWMGTFVAEGYGKAYVVASGDETEVGKLAHDLASIPDEVTPLQIQMRRISMFMLWFIAIVVTCIFVLGVMRGETIEMMLLTSIAIAVASIPEGLPAAVTIILAVGMEALLVRGGLVRNLLAAETLGSTTFILTDKTGTLTQGKMSVTDVVYVGCEHAKGHAATCDWRHDERSRHIFNVALCASDAYFDETQKDGASYIVRGEPMEQAILTAAYELGVSTEGESLRGKRLDYLSFTSDNRFSAGLAKTDEGALLCINGAPEYVLEASTHVHTPHGTKQLTREMRTHFTKLLHKETKEGKRLIAVGYKQSSGDELPEECDGLMSELTFAGILVFHDPVRKGVEHSVKGVMRAGVEIRLVTGDNPQTALTIAKAAGIAREHDIAMTGKDIAELSDVELLATIKTVRVFARILPRQKMRIAQVLQKSGQIVAMTGDGVNDASALQKAHIGIAIGSGTEVAKEASDLVLMNDNFETVYSAIEEGRRIIANLRKIVAYLIATSLSEAVLIGGALITGAAIPLLPAQILWSNIIEEGLIGLAFAFEPGDKNAMSEKPLDIHEDGVLSGDMLKFVGYCVVALSFLLLSLYAFMQYRGVSIEILRSVMFLAISIDSLFIAFSFRSLSTPLWKIPLRTNLFFLASFFVSVFLLLIVLSVPFLQRVFSYTPLPFSDIFLLFWYGFLALMIVEAGKSLIFKAQ